MADRLFQTISSGRPYHVVKGNDSNRNTVTAKSVDRRTCEPSISGADRRQRSQVSCAEGAGKTRVNVFDIEAQQTDSGRPLTTKSHLLRLQSKITIGTNSVNSSQLSEKPRMSLLGRPVGQTRRHRTTRENRQRRLQFLINNFLERPNGRLSVLYHLFV